MLHEERALFSWTETLRGVLRKMKAARMGDVFVMQQDFFRTCRVEPVAAHRTTVVTVRRNLGRQDAGGVPFITALGWGDHRFLINDHVIVVQSDFRRIADSDKSLSLNFEIRTSRLETINQFAKRETKLGGV